MIEIRQLNLVVVIIILLISMPWSSAAPQSSEWGGSAAYGYDTYNHGNAFAVTSGSSYDVGGELAATAGDVLYSTAAAAAGGSSDDALIGVRFVWLPY